jgi:ABC-2 type transport system permease protein
MPSAWTVYGWELRKLRFQKRTYLGLGAAVLVPVLFVLATSLRGGGPEDVAFGRYIHDSGLAIPLVLLLFGSIWLYPLITALVAGDIFASEDHNGTLKTVLTRSLERDQIFAGKALAAATYATVAILVSGVVGIVAGCIAITSIGLLLSTITRNSAAAVVGTLMVSLMIQLVGILPGLGSLHPYLLSTQFNAWQGLLRSPADWDPIVRSLWVCALYAVPCLVAAFLVFLRRDVAGG